MPSSRQIMSAFAAAAITAVEGAMGPAFSTGPVATNSFIREAKSTLILPEVPSGSSGVASLWVGMGTSNGDLIQSIADNWQSDDWAIFAYTLVKTGANSQMPVQSESTTAKAGDKVTMHYKFDDTSGNYTQYVSLNGNLVHTLSTSSGQAQGFGSAVECGENDCGTMPAHSWIDTEIIMDQADPNYINTLGKGQGVTGDLVTSDGGKTWTVDTIAIPGYNFGTGAVLTATETTETATENKAVDTNADADADADEEACEDEDDTDEDIDDDADEDDACDDTDDTETGTEPIETTPTTTAAAAPATTTASSNGATASHYAQCGGSNYSGPTTCESPYECKEFNPYYFQCL